MRDLYGPFKKVGQFLAACLQAVAVVLQHIALQVSRLFSASHLNSIHNERAREGCTQSHSFQTCTTKKQACTLYPVLNVMQTRSPHLQHTTQPATLI